jgi:hypothetical protein
MKTDAPKRRADGCWRLGDAGIRRPTNALYEEPCIAFFSLSRTNAQLAAVVGVRRGQIIGRKSSTPISKIDAICYLSTVVASVILSV